MSACALDLRSDPSARKISASTTLPFLLNYTSTNVSTTCANYYNGTNLTGPGFIVPQSQLLGPRENSFLVLTVTEGSNQNISGFAKLYNRSSYFLETLYDSYLGASVSTVYPPGYNHSNTKANATAVTLLAEIDLNDLEDLPRPM